MKVLVIVTGGTIGSVQSNGYIGLEEQSKYQLLSLYHAYMESQGVSEPAVEFITTSPYQRLSENNTGKVLGQLAESINAGLRLAKQEGCQGIIVTHGTDTLAYSAAMAGYLFMDCPVPVVFVSANYVLSDLRSNGLDNFHYALELIQNHLGGGVYVSYRNTGDVPRIHLGTRVLGHQPYSDDVYSVGGACAWFSEDGMHEVSLWKSDQSVGDEDAKYPLKLPWDAPILQIYPVPGMPYPAIPPATRAILHHTYHAGTICSETPGIDRFFEEAGRRQIPVFLTGADPELVYDSTRIFERFGIHVLPKASPVSMYVKLWMLLAAGKDPVEWMERELAGEYVGDM